MKSSPFRNCKWLCLICTAAYLGILGLLTFAEHRDPNASIQTFTDAFWYSLVTISTVGYGDLYPITTLGKLLGVVFIFLSLGFLTFLLGILVRIVTGRVLPALQLWMARDKKWYIFSCQNSAAFALAKNLHQQEPDCVLLFPESADRQPPETLRYLIYSGSPESLAVKNQDHCAICFLDGQDAYPRAAAALQTGHRVYCRTAFAPDICPENLTLFNPYDCCAQHYWQDHGLKPEEQTVVLIGDGNYAENLLIHGLLLNVFGPERTVRYHLFGNWEAFRRNHHRLAASLGAEGETTQVDRLHFHRDSWNQDPGLLASAHRILLCQDEPSINMDILGQIHRYFPVNGEIHLLYPDQIPGLTVFGTQDSVYTPQLVLREERNRAARTMHRIYCASAGGNAPGWEQLTEFQRQSNIAAADHLLTKIRLLLEDDSIHTITPENCRAAYDRYTNLSPEQKEACRRIEHRRWMRFYTMYNWSYGPVRNNAARMHPLLLPYEDLDPVEQAKDDHAWELLAQLAEQM